MCPHVGYVALASWQAYREQYVVDGGDSLWRLDPELTARIEGSKRLGFAPGDPFWQQGVFGDSLSGLPHCLVKVLHADRLFLLELCQPVRQGQGGIWTIERVNEMETETLVENGDGPRTGYVSLADEDPVHEQSMLAAGHNPWRLDPLLVARLTGTTRLGFGQQDRFFWRGLYKETVTGRQKAVVWAVCGPAVYHVELYQPALQGESGIWCVEHVMFLNPQRFLG